LLDPDPDPHSNCGSGYRRAKMTHKKRKKARIFMFLRAEGFSCCMGVLYGGLGRSKLQFLINKIEIKFPAINFFQF
jgi:23S rRNA maturation mini-RNase III